MYDRPRFLYAGDRALVVELGDGIDPDLNRRLHSLRDAICKAELQGVSDLIATYRSLLVYYDPISIDVERLKEDLARIESRVDASGLNRSRIIHLPTFYGGEYGPDLDSVAEHTGLPTEQVVETHSAADYLTYMMGFSPGFPYLGGLDERLHTPRLSTPRTEIPAGSVGIADSQTGVYPVASRGGSASGGAGSGAARSRPGRLSVRRRPARRDRSRAPSLSPRAGACRRCIRADRTT